MKIAKILVSLLLAFFAAISTLAARDEDSFAPVEQAARQRSRSAVTWQREQKAREQTVAEVRRLLRAPLTPNAAAQIALLNNRGLQSTFEEIGLAQADLIEARTFPNPELNVSARFPDKPPSGTDVEWSIAQNFLNILMIPLKAKVAKDQLLAAQFRVSDAITRLVAETKSAIYQLKAAEEILARLKVEQAAQATSLDLIQKLHEAGNITDLQLLQQQGEYSQSRLQIAQTEADIRERREKLNRLMGLWGTDTDWKVEPKLPDVPRTDFSIGGLETLAITQRYDLAASKAELESALRALGLEKAFRWIGALDFGIDSERDTDSQTITGPTLRLELPIFNQGQARVARALKNSQLTGGESHAYFGDRTLKSMSEKLSRRQLLGGAAVLAGTALLGRGTALGESEGQPQQPNRPRPRGQTPDLEGAPSISARTQPAWMRPPHPVPGEPGRHYRPTFTPNGSTLPWKVVDGVKIMHLTAEEVEHEFVPASEDNQRLRALCWGYNGQVHGPTIECVEGDRLRIYVTNDLPAATTIHWHAMLVPSGMDGVGGLSQKAIQPGETYKYEFTVWQHGTFMYHSHHDEMTQIALGMTGMIVVHPREPEPQPPDRDFVLLLHAWRIDVGTRRPNPNEMTEFNVLTMNARAFPGTAPLIAKLGDKVRIRLGNLSPMDHHPIHLHGHAFKIVATDGGPIPETAQWPQTSVLVAVGETRTVEFVANNPGDWPLHCHMTHHVMNQMGHQFPNMIGVKPGDLNKRARTVLSGFMTMGENGMADMGSMGMKIPKNSVPMVGLQTPKDYITMGGMYTNLKVRENLESYDKDPGWYQDPPGTLASLATKDQLQHDLGFVPGAQGTEKPMKSMHVDHLARVNDRR